MGRFKKLKGALCSVSAMLATSVFASPPCDDVTKAEGCIELEGGGRGSFAIAASFDVGTGGESGSLRYVDTGANFEVTSSALQDVSYLDTNVRGFIFASSGTAAGAEYNEVRVFVADWGSTGDEFEIQLLQNGTIVYSASDTLSPDCTGGGINGVVIASNCAPCVCPPGPEEPPQPPPTDDCKHHLHGKKCHGIDKCKHHNSGKHCSKHGDGDDDCKDRDCKDRNCKTHKDKGGKDECKARNCRDKNCKTHGNKADKQNVCKERNCKDRDCKTHGNKGGKGNNGVGNGQDPQPRGNPPINDGPGTGPGNPGNRGGAGANKQK